EAAQGDGPGPRGLPPAGRGQPAPRLERPRALLRRGGRGHAPHPHQPGPRPAPAEVRWEPWPGRSRRPRRAGHRPRRAPPRPGRRPRPPRPLPPPGRGAGEAAVLRRPHPARVRRRPRASPTVGRPALGLRPGLAGRCPRPRLTRPPAQIPEKLAYVLPGRPPEVEP